MKTTILSIPALAILICAPAAAQNSDLGLLGGVSVQSLVVRPGRHVEDSVNVSCQINYAAQLRETPAGRLYLELPVLFAGSVNDVVTPGLVTSDATATVFFTPGVRWHYTFHPRVAVYGAVGGGIASLAGTVDTVGGGVVSSRTGSITTGAFGFGGGLDFRLTRLLSLRGEGRDFLTRAGLAGDRGHHDFFFNIGIGFHF